MNRLIRFSHLVPLALGLVVLGGCATQEDPLQQQADDAVAQINATITKDVRNTVKQMIREKEAVREAMFGNMYNTTTQPMVGVALLEVTFDRQGRATKCETTPAEPRLLKMAGLESVQFDPQQYAEYLKQQCQDTIFPEFPDQQDSAEGLLTQKVPLAVNFSASDTRKLLSQNAQSEFFRQHLLRGERFNSIGLVQVSYRANAQGNLTECGINLVPLPSRINAYVPDPGLQERLISRCKKLNVRQMPDFSANSAPAPIREAMMKYTPWTTIKD